MKRRMPQEAKARSNVRDRLTGGRCKGRSRNWRRLGFMTGVFGSTESQRGNSLYLQNDIDQAAVRLALLVVVLITTALVLTSALFWPGSLFQAYGYPCRCVPFEQQLYAYGERWKSTCVRHGSPPSSLGNIHAHLEQA